MAKPPTAKQDVQKKPPEPDSAFALEIAKRVSSLVGREKANQVTAQVIGLFAERFSGPIAHPKHLREYEEILPGSADRIIRMAEEALAHSKKMDERVLEAQIQDTKDGRSFGFLALLALITAATICGLFGEQILAGAFLGTGALGVVGAFIKGRMESND